MQLTHNPRGKNERDGRVLTDLCHADNYTESVQKISNSVMTAPDSDCTLGFIDNVKSSSMYECFFDKNC